MEKQKNSMFKTLLNLRGNARACVWTEPLWGIPYNLCAPFVSLYMQSLGLSFTQIGTVASITLVTSIVFSVLSGALTDKLGRKKCTLIFDTLSWSVPELLWALSQNFAWFILAALFNGMWRVTVNSWGLLLIEDTDEEMVLRCFSLTSMMGVIAAFVAPLSKFAVDAYGVVPTMRVLYFITCVMMTTKFLVLNAMVDETRMGKVRMEETKNESLWRVVWGCKDVFLKLMHEKRMLLTICITAVFQIITTLNNNFWALYITDFMGIEQGNVALFTTLKSFVLLGCILFIVPRVRFKQFKRPTLVAWATFALAQILLLIGPRGAWAVPVLVLNVALEAGAHSVLSPVLDSLLFINAEPHQRARILGLVYGTVEVMVLIFPALAGVLADINIRSPFIMNLVMFTLGMALTVALSRCKRAQEEEA